MRGETNGSSLTASGQTLAKVAATRRGTTMPYQQITDVLIPRLAACRVERVTLTGGEPTIHPQFLDVVRAFRDAGMAVGVCTNATTLDDQQITALARIGGVHCNVSMDGFRPESHGRFRGDRDSFATTVASFGDTNSCPAMVNPSQPSEVTRPAMLVLSLMTMGTPHMGPRLNAAPPVFAAASSSAAAASAPLRSRT